MWIVCLADNPHEMLNLIFSKKKKKKKKNRMPVASVVIDTLKATILCK